MRLAPYRGPPPQRTLRPPPPRGRTWGSLLRGVLGHDDAVLDGVARLLAPGAEATALVSVVARDGAPPVPPRDDLERAYAARGLELLEARRATPEEVAASRSSWAKRLRAGTAARPVTLLRFAPAPPRQPRAP